MKNKWFYPTDFFTNYKTDPTRLKDHQDRRKKFDYRFKGYVCPECNVVYQFTPAGDQALIDFPTIGKDRKVCKNCA